MPKLNRTFYLEHPLCCYCGGKTPAKTIDHSPAKIIFSFKHRPMGLEFPSCHACNQGAKKHEQLAGLFSRLYPDGTTEAESKELEKLFRNVNRNRPGFIEELQPDLRQINEAKKFLGERSVAGVLNASGPIINESLEIFSAKMGYSLHYEATGKIVPSEGGVAVKWYTNFQKNDIHPDLFGLLGTPKGLKMGKWNTYDQFQYASAVSDTENVTAHFCTFRESFATLSWVANDILKLPKSAKIFRPGFLL